MGRWSYSHRSTVESQLAISISDLSKNNILNPGRYTLSWKVNETPVGAVRLTVNPDTLTLVVSYRWTSCHVSITVTLTRTPCHLGGERWWFLCPDCNRRVGFLYIDGSRVACRHCLDLRYTSQREQPFDRAIRRKQKLEVRLGVKQHGSGLIPIKKKGRHWRTHDALLRKLQEEDYTLEQRIDELWRLSQ